VTADLLLPVLDVARCTGCGDCVAVCPTACLASAGRAVWLPRPADCVACGACERVCPADAVTVTAVTPPAGPCSG
jgi:formate hydrogenlyase subunit 6/NADH:ubiquinone oxidoreductase subunit I